jgi:hypothetical protein
VRGVAEEEAHGLIEAAKDYVAKLEPVPDASEESMPGNQAENDGSASDAPEGHETDTGKGEGEPDAASSSEKPATDDI